MGRYLVDDYAKDVMEEVLASFPELAAEEVIPGLIWAIRSLAEGFPDPVRVLDEAADRLTE